MCSDTSVAATRRIAIVIAIATLVLVTAAFGAPHELRTAQASRADSVSSGPASPVTEEVARVFSERDAEIERLRTARAAAPDLQARLDLERRMGDVKRRAILEMFRIQRRHAVERGDQTTAAILHASIRKIEHRLAEGATLPPEDAPAKEVRP